MRDMHNADLCDTLGNLVHRATNLCQKYCDGVVPDVPQPDSLPIDLAAVVEAYRSKMDAFDLQGGANVVIQAFRDVNGYIQDSAPWTLKGDEHAVARQVIVRTTLEAIFGLAHMLLPFLPNHGPQIFAKLNTSPKSLQELKQDWLLVVGTKISVGDVLYSKATDEKDKAAPGAKAPPSKKESHAEAQRRKKEQKQKMIEKSQQGAKDAVAVDQPEFTKLDIRVGKILEVWNHEKADKLYCEKIDVGEESGPREIASGLRPFYSVDEMKDKLVLVVCNMKAQKMLGFASNGMVLAAKADDGSKVELVCAPEGAAIGERVFIEGIEGEPLSDTQVKKRKVFEAVSKDLVTSSDLTATWQGKTIMTSAGPCRVTTLVGAPIS